MTPAALAVAAITALAAALRLVSLGGSGTNPFYDAAVRSMGESWHNLFFAAFEPAAGVAIDKPPLDLWLQVASVKLFGWGTTALILPQALAATAAVPLLYLLARSLFGTAAGLASAACLAVLPVAVLTGRSDTMDSVMMLLNVVAALLVVRAAETDSRGLLLAAAAVVGLNFEVKLFEALVALPALTLLYLVATRRRRPVWLALAAAVAVTVALAWPAAVSLAPSHPYALGSTNGSVWNAIFVYNGTQRLNPPRYAPAAVPLAALSGSGAAPSPLRLFELGGNRFGQNFGIELAGAIAFGGLALVAGGVMWRRGVRPPRVRLAGALAIALWLLTGYVLFSRSRGVVYTRYLEAISPAVAIALGAGALACARLARRSRPGLAATLAALILTGAYAVEVGGSDDALKLVCAAATAVACVALLARRHVLATGALMLVPVLAPAAVRSHALVTRHASDSGGAAGAETSPVVRAESAFLQRNAAGARYEVATYSFARAAPLIVRDGRPVLVLTSYTSPVVSVAALERHVRRGDVRYALVGRCGAGCPEVVRWIRAHSTDVTAQAGLPGSGLLLRLASA